jgi:hypothetical protein
MLSVRKKESRPEGRDISGQKVRDRKGGIEVGKRLDISAGKEG